MVVQDELLEKMIEMINSKTVSRSALARKVGVSQSTLGRWKNRESKPTGVCRVLLAKILASLEKNRSDSGGSEAPAPREHSANEVKKEKQTKEKEYHAEKRKLQTPESGDGQLGW